MKDNIAVIFLLIITLGSLFILGKVLSDDWEYKQGLYAGQTN